MCLKGVISFVSSARTKNLLNKEKKGDTEVPSTQVFWGGIQSKVCSDRNNNRFLWSKEGRLRKLEEESSATRRGQKMQK